MNLRLFILTWTTLLSGSTLAADFASSMPVTVSVETGIETIKAEETVFQDGRKISHLDWKSENLMVLRGTLAIDVAPDWTVSVSGKKGLSRGGEMVDYDWMEPFYQNGSKSGWSHRSIHPNTRLDHYYGGSVELNRKLVENGSASLSAGIGAQYTDVKWTAYGGSYIYSYETFRDQEGSFNPTEAGITYRQKIPVLYASLNGSQKWDNWTLSAGLKAGGTVKLKDEDDHWVRSLRYDRTFGVSPMLGANLDLGYDLTASSSLYLSGKIEKTKFKRGDTTVRQTSTGQSAAATNAAGGGFDSLSIGLGIKTRF